MTLSFFDNFDPLFWPHLSPDTGATGGGATGTGTDADDDDDDSDPPSGGDQKKAAETFTREEMEAIISRQMKKQRKSLQQENQTQADLIKSLQSQLDDMRVKLDSTGNDPNDQKAKESAEIVQQRLGRKIEELEAKVRESEARALQAEQERRKSLRDQAISKAILALNVPDAVAAERYIGPLVQFSEEEQKWMLDWKGDEIDITPDNVKEVLPPVLREAPRVGGSGSFGGSTKKEKAARNLEEARKRLIDLRDKARRTSDQEDILQFQRQVRVVRELEQEFENAPK